MPRVNLADYIERRNNDAAIVIELADGVEVTVAPAELWSDAAYAAIAKSDMAEAVKLILGPKQHAVFTKAGGTWRILNGITAEVQGADIPKSPGSDEP